jgi:hypothetical protein
MRESELLALSASRTVYFFKRPCTPSPIKPRIRSAVAKVGSVDIISGLFVASSTMVSLSGEYETSASRIIGGIITIPIPMISIATGIMEVVATMIVALFTC